MSADQSAAKRRSGFYFANACVIAALILLSFPHTYFLPMSSGTKSFTLVRHLHGLAFFSFTALFVWQAWLVRRRGIARHRKWGTFGAALAGMMLVLGPWLAVIAIEDRMAQHMLRPYEFALYSCRHCSHIVHLLRRRLPSALNISWCGPKHRRCDCSSRRAPGASRLASRDAGKCRPLRPWSSLYD